jgi:hypothetical protein
VQRADGILEAQRFLHGLQPDTFVTVSNPELRKTLREAGYIQAQIADDSALVVFAA